MINPDDYEAVLVCGLKAADPFGDSLFGHCGECGAEIMFRPHSPHGEKVLKLCGPCAINHIVEMKKNGEEIECVVTPKTMEEVATAARPTGHKTGHKTGREWYSETMK